MAYASKAGRARVSASNPSAQAVCDRCGIWYNLVALRPQWDWAGPSLINKQLMVCRLCYDTPNEQLRSIVLPPDPVPVSNPRTEPFFADEVNGFTTIDNTVDPITGLPVIGGDTLVTQDGDILSPQQTGEPPGGLNQEPGTDANVPGNDDPGLPLGNTEVPKTGPL